jgi:hypothetical protein
MLKSNVEDTDPELLELMSNQRQQEMQRNRIQESLHVILEDTELDGNSDEFADSQWSSGRKVKKVYLDKVESILRDIQAKDEEMRRTNADRATMELLCGQQIAFPMLAFKVLFLKANLLALRDFSYCRYRFTRYEVSPRSSQKRKRYSVRVHLIRKDLYTPGLHQELERELCVTHRFHLAYNSYLFAKPVSANIDVVGNEEMSLPI